MATTTRDNTRLSPPSKGTARPTTWPQRKDMAHNFTENTYSFTGGFKLRHHYKDFKEASEAIAYAKELKKKHHIKACIAVDRYAYTYQGRDYWYNITYIEF